MMESISCFGDIVMNKEYVILSLHNNRFFSTLEYKCMEAINMKGLASCVKVMMDGRICMFYPVNGMSSVSTVIRSLNAKELSNVFYNIFSVINNVNDNDILNIEHLVLDEEMILVNKNLDVNMILCPISENHINYQETESHFYWKCLTWIETGIENEKRLNNYSSFWGKQLVEFRKKLNNKESFAVLLDFLKELHEERTVDKNINIDEKEDSQSSKGLIFEPLDMQKENTLIIDKEEYVIGRKRDLVDGYVGEGKREIGRKHCKIVKDKNGYYVIDLDSKNGTYLNGIVLKPNIPYALADGCILRLADKLSYRVSVF